MSSIASVGKTRYDASWVPAMFLLIGIVSLLLLIGANWARQRMLAVDILRLNALVEIQLSVSAAHLWLEEYLTGDDIELANIANSLERADKLSHTLVEGGFLRGIDIELPRLVHVASNRQAIAMRNHFHRFAELLLQRQTTFENGGDVGAGSAVDIEHDLMFSEFMSASKELEQTTRYLLEKNIERSKLLFRTMLLLWGALIALATVGLWTRNTNRRRSALQLARAEAQLYHSQKMAAVGRLASGVTHDINNYLAAITTNCELAQMHAKPGDSVDTRMDVILGVVRKASMLIARLLAFTRQKPRQVEVVDLNRLILDQEDMLRQFTGAAIDLDFKLQQGLWNTKLDPTQVEQIVMNLVVNASEAMPDGGKLCIETSNAVLDQDFAARHTSITPGEYVLLSVSDTGTGVPVDIQDKIFEPFFTTKDDSSNSGLGLSTVYGLVTQNNGHIWLYSEPPHGTIFKIYLPRAFAITEKKSRRVTPHIAAKTGSEGVLLVEDNDEFRASIQSMLGELGYDVITAKNGKEALSIFAHDRNRINLLISDVVMPGIGGKELVEAIREQGDDIPVIFVSGYSENVTLSEGLLDGEIRLLQKPFSTESLASNIRNALDRAPL